jgi:hypothetical protein
MPARVNGFSRPDDQSGRFFFEVLAKLGLGVRGRHPQEKGLRRRTSTYLHEAEGPAERRDGAQERCCV